MNTFSNNSLYRKRFAGRGGVVAVIISFLLGFVFAFVAVAGTVYYLATSITVKEGVEKIGGLTGNESLRYEDYISEEYAEKTLLQLITQDVVSLVNKAGDQTLTLNDINAISPIVGTKIEEIADMLQDDYGISLTAADLMGTSISGIGDYINTTIKNVDLGQLLSAPKINIMVEDSENYDLLMALCYGDASHYDIVDGSVVMKDGYSSTKIGDFMDDAMGVLEKAPLDKVLSVNADSDVILLALCYGGDYEITDGEIVLPAGKISTTLGDLLNTPSDVLSDIELGTVMQLTGNSDPITLALAYGKKGVDYEINADGEIVSLAGGKEPTTIGDLMGESDFFDDLKDTLTLGELLTIDESSSQVMQTLKNKTLNELTQEETINGLKLGELLTIDETDPSTSNFLIALKDTTVEDLGNQETVNNLKLSEILEIDSSSSKILQALAEKTVADLGNQETVNNLKLNQILEIDSSSSKILQALAENTVADLGNQETVNNLKLNQILEIDSSSSKILQALAENTVADLGVQDTINALKLNDVMNIGESSPRIIREMSEWTIADLSGSGEKNIETDLTLAQILGDDAMTGNILGNLKKSTIGSLAGDINNLTIQQVIGDEELYVDPNAETKVLKGTWKYLLQDSTTGEIGEYKITEMSKMITNMTNNIQKASIKDLSDDGIIDVTGDFCNQNIMYKYEVAGNTIFNIPEDEYKGKTTIGELTITEMLEYLSTVLGALNKAA